MFFWAYSYADVHAVNLAWAFSEYGGVLYEEETLLAPRDSAAYYMSE
jgi:hypothetical protein